MIRFFQLSVLIVLLLVARYVLYRWTQHRDTLPSLIGRGLTVVVAYLAYVMAGLVALSWIADRGFGEGSTVVAVALILAAAAYVGIGVGGLWLYLRREDERAAARKRRR